MAVRSKRWVAFDPYLERLVPELDSSSDRIRTKLEDAYSWCFCELCWRPTEFSTSVEAPKVIKRLTGGNAKEIPLSGAMRLTAQKRANALVMRYEQACRGEFGPYEAPQMYFKYCNAVEMRGDRSVDGFRDHVERRMLLTEWARHGELARLTRPPFQQEGTAKPSKLYCESHNPRRSDEARRAYQRDRRFEFEYHNLIEQLWRQDARNPTIPTWDIEAHAHVRREAYRQLQALKSPTRMIDNFLSQGIVNQTEIARQLGISRQAVSAAIKRRTKKLPRRQD